MNCLHLVLGHNAYSQCSYIMLLFNGSSYKTYLSYFPFPSWTCSGTLLDKNDLGQLLVATTVGHMEL